MRPLEPFTPPHERCFDRPELDDRDAPVSAQTSAASFWDHLGATRAEEYAAEDILSDLPVPAAPVEPVIGFAPLTDMPDTSSASLNDVLLAHDLSTEESDLAEPEPIVPVTSAPVAVAPVLVAPLPEAGHGLAIDAAHLPPVAPFAADPPPSRRKRRSCARRRAPSRLGYRLQRIWLTPLYRNTLKLGTPILAMALGIAVFFHDEERRAMVADAIEEVRAAFIDRPEFMVTALRLPEVSPELDAVLSEALKLELPLSSFRLDLDALRASIEELDWVRSADLRLVSDGVLTVSVTERVPAILWRSPEGLELLDAEGVRVAFVLHRGVRPDLPLIAGEGAQAHVAEALDLIDAAAPLGARMRGLVRMGERRWDVVLDRDQRIKLPERGAVAALERVIALEQAQDLLSRDLIVADMRNPARPVLQISAGAMETLRDIRSQSRE